MEEKCENCKFYRNKWCELFFIIPRPDYKCRAGFMPKEETMDDEK